MFYCDACKVDNGWPEALMKSFGPCELCGTTGVCHDKPSFLLTYKN